MFFFEVLPVQHDIDNSQLAHTLECWVHRVWSSLCASRQPPTNQRIQSGNGSVVETMYAGIASAMVLDDAAGALYIGPLYGTTFHLEWPTITAVRQLLTKYGAIRIRKKLLIPRVILVTATPHAGLSEETSGSRLSWCTGLEWGWGGNMCIQNFSASLLSASIVGYGGSSFATIVLWVPLVVCHVNISQRGIPLRSPFQKHSIPGLWLFQGASSTLFPIFSPCALTFCFLLPDIHWRAPTFSGLWPLMALPLGRHR